MKTQTLISTAVFFALASCAIEPAANRASIGATGGALHVSQGALRGASITVPPGALAQTVTITMNEGAAPTMLAESVEATGAVLVMGPEGQTFSTPVTLTIPTNSAATEVLTRPLGGSRWTSIEGATFDAARNAMIVRVSHFSEFVPVRRRACRADSDCAAGQRCTAGVCTASSGCGMGLTACSGACVSLASDPRNCGACGSSCAAGRSCVAGVCTSSSADAGVDAGADASPMCRADSDCASGQRCTAGMCTTSGGCPAGTTACGGACVNLASDARNCGACGSSCAAGQACVMGACRSSMCSPSPERCNGRDDDCDGAIDESDPMSPICASGQTCRAGACVASGSCSVDSDCASGQRCTAGMCTTSGGCPAGTTACGGACVNLASDARNCGACGSSCAAGQACVMGACR